MNEPNMQIVRSEAGAGELIRRATDVAGVCKDIVTRTALTIQGRKYVRVEGWQSIATAYGCILSARDVEKVEGGFRAVGEVRKMTTGEVIATAEGFVGADETTWFGGEIQTKQGPKTLPKRAEYAIRAMAQTRAMSRAGRTAFAFVVVLMDAGLDTVPAEEAEAEDFDTGTLPKDPPKRQTEPLGEQNATQSVESTADWREVKIHFGKGQGTMLGDLSENALATWVEKWTPSDWPKGSGVFKANDLFLRKALDQAAIELGLSTPPKTTQGTK